MREKVTANIMIRTITIETPIGEIIAGVTAQLF